MEITQCRSGRLLTPIITDKDNLIYCEKRLDWVSESLRSYFLNLTNSAN